MVVMVMMMMGSIVTNCNPSVTWRLPVSTFLLSGDHIRFKLLLMMIMMKMMMMLVMVFIMIMMKMHCSFLLIRFKYREAFNYCNALNETRRKSLDSLIILKLA